MGEKQPSHYVRKALLSTVALATLACGFGTDKSTPTPEPTPTSTPAFKDFTEQNFLPSTGTELTVFLEKGQAGTLRGKKMTIPGTVDQNCEPVDTVFPDAETVVLLTAPHTEHSVKFNGVRTAANTQRTWTVDPNNADEYWRSIREQVTAGKSTNFAKIDPETMQVLEEGTISETKIKPTIVSL